MKYMLYLCIEIIFGLTNGCRILEINFCRLTIMILARSTRKFGDHGREREDYLFVIVAEDHDILLRNALGETLVASVVRLWTMKYWIALE
jgi:hypothetical protein